MSAQNCQSCFLCTASNPIAPRVANPRTNKSKFRCHWSVDGAARHAAPWTVSAATRSSFHVGDQSSGSKYVGSDWRNTLSDEERKRAWCCCRVQGLRGLRDPPVFPTSHRRSCELPIRVSISGVDLMQATDHAGLQKQLLNVLCSRSLNPDEPSKGRWSPD